MAREYFADSAFLSMDSFGGGWLHAGGMGVFAPDGSMRRHWLAPGVRGRRAAAYARASSAAWKLPEERRSA